MDGYSKSDVLKFLDFLADKGMMKADTVTSRRVALSAVLGVLDDEEVLDVRQLNMEDAMSRFINKKGSGFRPESLKIYKARATKAIEDFLSYKKDPLSFKSGASPRSARNNVEKPAKQARRDEPETISQPRSQNTHPTNENDGLIFPIPIRPGVVIKVAGIPSDLTTSEAKRVSSVILALASVD